MMKRMHRRFIATVFPPYFIDANQFHSHRSLSDFPIKLQPSSSAGFRPRIKLTYILARPHGLTVTFTSGVPRWKTRRCAFSIGTPPECVSENPRSDWFWVRPPVLAKGSREISLMTAVDPFNHRFAWAAKGFRSSTGLICLKLNNIAIENNPSRMIVSRKNFSPNACAFKGWCSKIKIFKNFFPQETRIRLKFLYMNNRSEN